MEKYRLAIWVLLMLFSMQGYSQKLLGVVFQKNEKGVDEPLPGANAHWLNTSIAASTKENGVFIIEHTSLSNKLVVSLVA